MDGAAEEALSALGLHHRVDGQLSHALFRPGEKGCAGYVISGCGLQLILRGPAINKGPATDMGSGDKHGSCDKQQSPPIEIRGLLHEKIQLYIYKPSINSESNACPPDMPSKAALAVDGTKINSLYYGEFTE